MRVHRMGTGLLIPPGEWKDRRMSEVYAGTSQRVRSVYIGTDEGRLIRDPTVFDTAHLRVSVNRSDNYQCAVR